MQIYNRKYYLKNQLLGALAAVVMITAGFGVFQYLQKPMQPEIPTEVTNKLTFTPIVVDRNNKKFNATDYKLVLTEEKIQVLSYDLALSDGTIVNISQNTQPTQFTDIPEYKDRFLSGVVKQYDTVPSSIGTIYLGRLDKQNNAQIAVILEKGLLIFMKPSKELSSQQWREIGDALEIYKKPE